MPEECETCRDLFEQVEKHLLHISEITREQASALVRRNLTYVDHLDKELEHAIGAKERSLGALKQHWSEHEH